MKSILSMLIFVVAVSLASFATITTIDFESTPLGTYSVLSFPGATLTYTGGNNLFDVVASGSPGFPIAGNAFTADFQNGGNIAPFRVDFSVANTYFQIGAGDYDSDDDPIYLWAYDAGGNLLASDSNTIPASLFGGFYLTVSTATPISYVLFTSEGVFPQSVYWDNMSYNAVPEPGSLLLLGSGVFGLAGVLRRKLML